MLTLVIARYQEDISWVNLVRANLVVVDKAQIDNTGREAASYLWFIASHYHSLQGDYLFCQGDPFAHCPDFDHRVAMIGKGEGRGAKGERYFGPRMTCDWTGAPHHPGLNIGAIAGQLPMPLPEELEFTAGAQFLTSADDIRVWPQHIYQRAHKIANEDPQAPWIFERLWDYLIPVQNSECQVKNAELQNV